MHYSLKLHNLSQGFGTIKIFICGNRFTVCRFKPATHFWTNLLRCTIRNKSWKTYMSVPLTKMGHCVQRKSSQESNFGVMYGLSFENFEHTNKSAMATYWQWQMRLLTNSGRWSNYINTRYSRSKVRAQHYVQKRIFIRIGLTWWIVRPEWVPTVETLLNWWWCENLTLFFRISLVQFTNIQVTVYTPKPGTTICETAARSAVSRSRRYYANCADKLGIGAIKNWLNTSLCIQQILYNIPSKR